MKNGSEKSLADAFLTPKEAATYLRVSMLTMYLYMKKPRSKGGPPVRKFGASCYRLPRQEFIEWANPKPEK